MSELLTIDGLVLPGRQEVVAVVVRPEVTATPPSWLLPLTAAALLHLGILVILGVMVHLSPLPERVPEVLPIRLYAAGEVSSLAESVESASFGQTPPHSRPVSHGSGNEEPAASVTAVATSESVEPFAGLPGAAQSSPVSAPVLVREVAFSAPLLSEGADGVSPRVGSAVMLIGESASPLGVAPDRPTGGVVATLGDKSMVAGGEVPVVVLARPLYRENPPPEYPALAKRRQQEGTVVLEVLVGADGRVAELAVQQSSGYLLLDEAALKGVKSWRFVPGQRGAAAVAMPVLVPVRFGLR